MEGLVMNKSIGGTLTKKGFIPYARNVKGYDMPVRIHCENKDSEKNPVLRFERVGLIRPANVEHFVYVDIDGGDVLVPVENVKVMR
jgi:hypothetical protein